MDIQVLYLRRAAGAARGRDRRRPVRAEARPRGVALALHPRRGHRDGRVVSSSGATCAPATCFNGDVYTWLQSGDLKLAIGFLIDPLTATMMLVVTFVSLMVHIYTIGYMADDDGYTLFFSLYLAVHVQRC